MNYGMVIMCWRHNVEVSEQQREMIQGEYLLIFNYEGANRISRGNLNDVDEIGKRQRYQVHVNDMQMRLMGEMV